MDTYLGEIRIQISPLKLFKIKSFIKNFSTEETTGSYGSTSELN